MHRYDAHMRTFVIKNNLKIVTQLHVLEKLFIENKINVIVKSLAFSESIKMK